MGENKILNLVGKRGQSVLFGCHQIIIYLSEQNYQ